MKISDLLPLVLENLKTMTEEQALFVTVMSLRQSDWRAETLLAHLQATLARYKENPSRFIALELAPCQERPQDCQPTQTETSGCVHSPVVHIVPSHWYPEDVSPFDV